MKKFLKSLISFALVCVCVLAFTGCGPVFSKTTVDTSKVEQSNGVTTNGGTTVVRDGYLYFINGTKTNDGKNPYGNKRGAVCRVKYNQQTGEADGSTYEVVVDDLVGFNYGSLYVFGDFLYFTSPSTDVNYHGDVLYYKTRFMRYDLVNKNKQTIYITKQNAEKETTSFAYYVCGEELNLLVYESQNATLTSIKIGDSFQTNYVLNDLTSCVFSENFGTCVTDGKTVDANSYVFYTKNNDLYDQYQTGSKVFRVLPNKNSSVCLSEEGLEITLLCIRNGKLVFSYDSRIYVNEITGEQSETLKVETKNVISYSSYEDIIFIENDDGSISVLYYDKNNYQIVVLTWKNGVEINSTTINVLSKSEDFNFVSLVTIDEVIEEDNAETADVDETKTQSVKYLFYIDTNAIYKLEIARKEGSEYAISAHSQPIKLTKSKVSSPVGTLNAEVVGNKIFFFANEVDEKDKETGNVYLHSADITVDENLTEYAKMIGIKE